ncbi:MAG: DUF4139 domain-containing protein [Paracoccus sp. (in: a-proteobacteria)]|nr:DUF4139 domain-containing protein [Paracoccus sp. (in: a-proteobacteria)]
MRRILTSTAILLATPLGAEVIETTAPVAQVTLYPDGASIAREIALDLPEGAHEIVVTGVPQGLDPAGLRVTGEGATIGAVSMQQRRPLPDRAPDSAQVEAAREEVQRRERELHELDARIALIRADGRTAEDMISIIRTMSGTDGVAGDDPFAFAARAEARIREARAAMIEAETEALAAEQSREDYQRALDRARAAFAALTAGPAPQNALIIAVEGAGGPAQIRVVASSHAAAWAPVYDLRLTQDDGQVQMDRGVLVWQQTGEDWTDAALTFSTARPSDRAAPSELSPRIIRAIDPQTASSQRNGGPAAAPALTRESSDAAYGGGLAAMPVMLGATLIYDYPRPVTIRSGADALRLSLESATLEAEITAEAVPSRDNRAYLVADLVNSTGEVLLPGQATLYSDGAMVAQTALPLIPPDEEVALGFGAIDGIVLERRTPSRATGERGLISRTNRREETAILSARNLTGRDWPLRLVDQVPVSEQETLRVDWTASIPPTETDPEDKRGLLVWERDLAAGEVLEITLDTTITWPEGTVLRE